MSDAFDIAFVRETYEKMTDEEVIRNATQDAAGLTPEARDVVKAEIRKRGLNVGILNAVDAQNKQYTIGEIDQYCELVRSLDCPVCGSSENKLNATVTGQVFSFIVITRYEKRVKIACPDCLDKANSEALFMTAAFGWWGLPWGIIRSIQSIILNLRSKRTNRSTTPNDYLRGVTLGKIGQIEVYKEDKDQLQQLIAAI